MQEKWESSFDIANEEDEESAFSGDEEDDAYRNTPGSRSACSVCAAVCFAHFRNGFVSFIVIMIEFERRVRGDDGGAYESFGNAPSPPHITPLSARSFNLSNLFGGNKQKGILLHVHGRHSNILLRTIVTE